MDRTLALAALLLLPALASAGAGKSAVQPLERPVPAPPPVVMPPPPPGEHKAPAAPRQPAMTEFERQFAILRKARQNLMLANETSYYIGHRHMKIYEFGERLYEVAIKWVKAYREAIRKLEGIPIAEYLCAPEQFVQLREAVEWGKLHAIGEPNYYKKGYRRAAPVLNPQDTPPCLWESFPPR